MMLHLSRLRYVAGIVRAGYCGGVDVCCNNSKQRTRDESDLCACHDAIPSRSGAGGKTPIEGSGSGNFRPVTNIDLGAAA